MKWSGEKKKKGKEKEGEAEADKSKEEKVELTDTHRRFMKRIFDPLMVLITSHDKKMAKEKAKKEAREAARAKK